MATPPRQVKKPRSYYDFQRNTTNFFCKLVETHLTNLSTDICRFRYDLPVEQESTNEQLMAYGELTNFIKSYNKCEMRSLKQYGGAVKTHLQVFIEHMSHVKSFSVSGMQQRFVAHSENCECGYEMCEENHAMLYDSISHALLALSKSIACTEGQRKIVKLPLIILQPKFRHLCIFVYVAERIIGELHGASSENFQLVEQVQSLCDQLGQVLTAMRDKRDEEMLPEIRQFTAFALDWMEVPDNERNADFRVMKEVYGEMKDSTALDELCPLSAAVLNWCWVHCTLRGIMQALCRMRTVQEEEKHMQDIIKDSRSDLLEREFLATHMWLRVQTLKDSKDGKPEDGCLRELQAFEQLMTKIRKETATTKVEAEKDVFAKYYSKNFVDTYYAQYYEKFCQDEGRVLPATAAIEQITLD